MGLGGSGLVMKGWYGALSDHGCVIRSPLGGDIGFLHCNKKRHLFDPLLQLVILFFSKTPHPFLPFTPEINEFLKLMAGYGTAKGLTLNMWQRCLTWESGGHFADVVGVVQMGEHN